MIISTSKSMMGDAVSLLPTIYNHFIHEKPKPLTGLDFPFPSLSLS